MKRKLILVATSICFLAGLVSARQKNFQNDKKNDICYCALLKSGKMTLMADGKQLYANVKLDKGIKITIDGTVIYPNGDRVVLKNGECVNQEGNIVDFSNPKDKKAQNDKTKTL
jgi:uncharacterized protein DUF6799